jgi:hypothetical protein
MRPALVTALATLFAAATVSASDKSAIFSTTAIGLGRTSNNRDQWNQRPPSWNRWFPTLVSRNIPTSFLDDDNKRAAFFPFNVPTGYYRSPSQDIRILASDSNKRSIESSEELEDIKKALWLGGLLYNRPPPYISTFPKDLKASGKRSIGSSEELDDIKKAFVDLRKLLRMPPPYVPRLRLVEESNKKAFFPGRLLPTCMCIRAPCPCDGSSQFPYYRDSIRTHQPSGNKRSIESSEELEDIKKAYLNIISPGPFYRPDLRLIETLSRLKLNSGSLNKGSN